MQLYWLRDRRRLAELAIRASRRVPRARAGRGCPQLAQRWGDLLSEHERVNVEPPAVRRNVRRLRDDGHRVVDPVQSNIFEIASGARRVMPGLPMPSVVARIVAEPVPSLLPVTVCREEGIQP
ncbi:hypothetical protein AB0C02_22875 [Micromonospora sp. NPDC048999]|uniref:hypothetical protein n=1 Tax=Micromonospora sp. NPDC048999 TaxID=3155391 RepID=UPI0033CC3DEF